MKKIIHILHLTVFILIFLLTSFYTNAQEKFTLYPYMVTNESGDGDATRMVDEQEFAGDPLSGNANQPSTKWSTSYGSTYPMGAYIDLGQELDLMHIFIFDYNGVADLIVEYGEPGNWNYLFTEPLNKYKTWKQHDVNITTRYLRMVKTSASAQFSEVVIYANSPVPLPPAITDLTAVDSLPQSVALQFTCVEENAATGELYAFDVRYSTNPITEENFSSAIKYPVGITPVPGTLQQMTVDNLTPNTRYYFAVKALGEIQSTYISNTASCKTPFFPNQVETKLVLTPEMVVNESGMGDAGKMVDEQDLSGDPLNGNSGNPYKEWYPSSNLSDYPLSAYIDLGTELVVTKVFVFDYNSVGDLVVESGEPGDWHYLFTEPLDNYKTWKQHDVDVMTSYLRITKMHREAKFTEIVVYGYHPVTEETKIPLEVSMMDNVSGYGDATTLVDEQEIAGDLLNSPGGNPVTYWETGFNSSIPYPLHCVLDMGKKYQLSKIFIRDINNSDEFRIWGGYDENWELLVVDNLTGYLSWNQHDVDYETRFLKIGKASAKANVAEIVLYGYDKFPGSYDSVPPAAVTDLYAMPSAMDQVKLIWTAPGDDGHNGTAAFYKLYYDTKPIDPENPGQALRWKNMPAPAPGGSVETIAVEGLNPDTRYYFALITADDALNYSDISNLPDCKTDLQIGGDPYRFTLTFDMLLNESTHGDAKMLIDEQSISGDPKMKNPGTPVNRWEVGSAEWKYPAYALIDLQGLCDISDIYLFDAADQGEDSIAPVHFYTGEPFSWEPLFTDELTMEDTWRGHVVNVQSRFLRVEIPSPETRFNELIIYGTRLEEPVEPPLPQFVHKQPVTVDQMIGINTFVNDPMGRMKVAGFVREYHNWMWCEGNNSISYPGYPNNQNEFNTLGWNFDYFYQNLKQLGITACPDIQGNTPWLMDFDYSRLSDKPVPDSLDPTLPSSYAAHADHMFQYAARYGFVEVADSLLKLAPDEHRYSGLGLLRYYENWNEQDKWWKGGGAFFNPYEYAAMASADCDGHMGTMGATFGVKNADPKSKLVMAGLADPDLDYVKAMKLWSDYHRNGDFPVDVINVHHYCNDGNSQTSGSIGISPEAGDLKGLMTEFVQYRNTWLPGKEVWITEFGYDTHPSSVQRAPAIASYSQEEVQAQWLVRSYLALAAAGVDRAVMYMLRDTDPTSTSKFSTSGLVSYGGDGYQPKTSWYYVYTMKNRLKNMIFHSIIPSGNPDVWIYRFIHTRQNLSAYVIWSPTSDGTVVENYQLNLPGTEPKATLVEMEDGSITGNAIELSVDDYKVSVSVSERPVFVMAYSDDYNVELEREDILLSLDTSMVVNECGHGDAGMLVDEQALSGDPLNGQGGEPVMDWSPGYGATYPCHAYIDLGQTYDISTVFIRDMNNTGEVILSTGSPGNWTESARDDLGRYKVWSGHVINTTSRYMRVTLTGPGCNLSEILFYVRDN